MQSNNLSARRESTSMAPPAAGATQAAQQPASNPQNLNHIVIEYLHKKGYNRTEQMLRQESAHMDESSRLKLDDAGPQKYFTAFTMLTRWIEDSLELYKAELRRLLWPVFVYSFITIISDLDPDSAGVFLKEFGTFFARTHAEDIRLLEPVRHTEHLEENTITKAYRDSKYRLTLTSTAFYSLVQFLESKHRQGGAVITYILNNYMNVITTDRAQAGQSRAFDTMLARLHGEDDIPDEDEGVPGHNPGSANTDRNAPPVLPRLSLAPLPMESDMAEDVRAELDELDKKQPPELGQNSLVEELEMKIKSEPNDDAPAPTREAVPLPQSLARDVAMEVQRIKENRDRLQIPARTGGIGPGVSVTMFTFHNTFDSINCLDFSGDNLLLAAGTAESYIRVWAMDGEPLPSVLAGTSSSAPQLSSSRRLIGHSGPVFAVSFGPAAAIDSQASGDTKCRYLLSSSADKSVRLWSVDTWSCLVAYKGHDQPVWDITWGPFGHYFLTGGHDRTARLWSTNQIAPLRLFVGHDQDVDCVAFHPNNAYVFTGSSDKTVRMWDVSRGSAAVGRSACAVTAKAAYGACSWSVEGTLLVSGGADNTVRIWDALQKTEGISAKGLNEVGAKTDGSALTSVSGVSATGDKKSKGKDATVTPDQISAFPTKKSPVYKVRFTNMNLVVAGGAYMP